LRSLVQVPGTTPPSASGVQSVKQWAPMPVMLRQVRPGAQLSLTGSHTPSSGTLPPVLLELLVELADDELPCALDEGPPVDELLIRPESRRPASSTGNAHVPERQRRLVPQSRSLWQPDWHFPPLQ